MEQSERTFGGGRGWRVGLIGVALGLLAAGSASSQSTAWADQTVTTASVPASASSKAAVVSAERQVVLADGRRLVLSADGRSLVLWPQQARRQQRTYALSPQRAGASLTMLPSGRVLLWGGTDARGVVQAGGQWFDPELSALEAANDVPLKPRAGHGATVLTDGRVLLAGGEAAAEVWQTGDKHATTVADAVWPAPGAVTATLQANGQVRLQRLVTQGRPQAAMRWFDPERGQWRDNAAPEPAAAQRVLAGSLPVQNGELATTAPLALRFNTPLKLTALSSAQVTLMGPGGSTAIRLVPAEGGRLLFVHPRQELFPGTPYTLLVDGLRTAAGAQVPLLTLDFQTRAAGTSALSAETETATPADTAQALMAGNATQVAAGCDPARGPCAAQAQLRDGSWTPGRNSTDGRWRVAASQPALRPTDIMARVTAAAGLTTVMGRILQVDEQPVANVEVSIGRKTARTDADGNFLLYEVPAGHQEIYVDGTTANRRGAEYGQFVVGVEVTKGQLTQLPYTMYLPKIRAQDKIRIPSPLTRDVVLQHPDMPGLKVQIPAGTVIRDRKGKIVHELALVPTPVNRAPFPVAANYPMYFTVEPGGAVIQGLTPESAKGVRIFYPNYDNHPTGTQANFWIYDPAEGWRVYGKGRVTTDQRYFAPEQGVALHQLMGGSYSMDDKDPPSEDDKPECTDGCGSAQGGGGATAGDPIDLRTGKFFYEENDLVIPDVVPIRIGRSYRSTDVGAREFGVATALNYEYKLAYPSATEVRLITPAGIGIVFTRTSGSGLAGTWVQTGSVTSYNGSKLEWTNIGNESGYLLTFPDGSKMAFYKYAPNYLLWQEDRFGNRTTFTYDAGLLARVTSPSGRYVTLERDANKRIKAVRDMQGNSWGYDYNADGFLATVTYPDQTTRKYEYVVRRLQDVVCPTDARYQVSCDYLKKMFSFGKQVFQHGVTRVFDRRGTKILENTFEALPTIPNWIGGVSKQVLADGSFYAFDYGHQDAQAPATERVGTLVTAPDGSRRRVTWITGQKFPTSDTIAYGTPQAQKVTFERGSYGQMSARIDALGRRTEYSYNGIGQVTQVKLVAGSQSRTVKATYNTLGDLESYTDALSQKTTLTYTNGCLTRITNPLGKATTITCNSAGQPLTVKDALGKTTTLGYDFYNLASVTDPLGRSVQLRYDSQGRPVAIQDPQGNISRVEYDAFGRVKKSIDASGNVTETAYDGNNNVKAVLLPHGNGITYDYDNRDRLITRTDALAQVERWTYDSMDRVKTYTDRLARTTTYAYDVLGRPTTTTYPTGGGTQTATYDNGNRLRTLVDSLNGTLGWDYSDFDELIKATTPQGSVLYTYDAAGQRKTMTPASQAAITYDYDVGSRLKKIQQGSEIVTFDYDDGDRLTKQTLPNNVATNYVYDDASQLTGLSWNKQDGTLIGSLGYGYNNAGQIVAQTGTYAPQTLPAASTGANAFDDNGRQTQYNGAALSYDANGNLIGDGSKTYVWNVRNQLEQIKQGASVIASFSYDALGRRTARTENGSTTSYLYDGTDAVQETVGSTVNPILTGLGIDQRFARNDTGGRSYFLTDLLGSTRALTNASGGVVNRYNYDPYGAVAQTNTGFTNPYQYTGREKDANGLMYYRARYYNPAMARFISEDPIGLGGGINMYAYVGGNPVRFTDPTGEVAFLAPLASAYLRCTLSCIAMDKITDALMDGCASMGDIAKNCALECLNPLNWAKKGKADDLLKMANNNKKTRKIIDGLQDQINEHREKIRKNPNSRDVHHWQSEINAWQERIDRLKRRLP